VISSGSDLQQLLTSPCCRERNGKVAREPPYNISSQVLSGSWSAALFRALVLIWQKEVGDRLVGPCRCKDYGALTVLLGLHFDIRREFIVKPGAFPADSQGSIRRAQLQPWKSRGSRWRRGFLPRAVKGGFNQRRKTLLNSLRSAGFDAEGRPAFGAFPEAASTAADGGETLTLHEFARPFQGTLAGKLWT